MTEVTANLCLIKLKYLTHDTAITKILVFPQPSDSLFFHLLVDTSHGLKEGLKWLELAQRWLLQNYDVTITHSQLVVF